MSLTANQEFQLMQNALLDRRALLEKMLDPRRDMNAECGYPDTVSIDDYRKMYDREGISARVVDILPDESWTESPAVVSNQAGNETAWEKEIQALDDAFNIFEELATGDRLSGVGEFGILLFGFGDGKKLDQPVDGVTGIPIARQKTKGTSTTKRDLSYLRTFDQSVVKITKYETDDKSPRYGQPVMYQVVMTADALAVATGQSIGSAETRTLDVHWTRVLHLADNRMNSKVFGVPRMRNVYNRLHDLWKVLGGSAEMFWKGGFPGISIETTPGAPARAFTPDEIADLKEQVQDYQNTLQRYLALTGMTAKTLAPQVADPTNHFTTAIKAICISKGYPYRIFMGTEEAQLAGTQDQKNWSKRIARRQNTYLTPKVVRPFIDRLMEAGVLSRVDRYWVNWPSADVMSEKEKAEVAKAKAEALAAYISGDVQLIVAPQDFLTFVMGISVKEAEAILKNTLEAARLEDTDNDDPDADPDADTAD